MAKYKGTGNQKETRMLTPLIGFTFLLLVLAGPIVPGLGDHMLIKASVVEIYICIIALLFIFKFNDGSIHYIKTAVPVTLALFITWGILSLFWSTNPDFGVVILFKWIAGAMLATLIFQIQKYAELMKILAYMFAGCVILSTIGIAQHLLGFDLFLQSHPPASTFAHRNMAGQMVVLSGMLGVFLLLQSTSKKSFVQYYYAIGTSLALAFAVYTTSRAVWFSILAQIILLAVFLVAAKVQKVKVIRTDQINRRAVLTAIIMLFTLINFDGNGFKPAWETVGGRIAQIEEQTSHQEGPGTYTRFILWQSTFDMIKDRPVMGFGLGGFEASHQAYAFGDTVYARQTHNDYLQYTAELGVGMVLTVLILGALFITKGIQLISATHENHSLARFYVLAMLAGIAVDCLFSFPLQLVGPTILISALLGVFFRLNHMEVESDRKISLASPIKPALLVFVIPLTLVIIWSNIEWHVKLGELNEMASAKRTRQKLDLNTLIENPSFRRFVWILTNQYRVGNPRKAEKIAKAFAEINDSDVIVNNTLAISSVLQKNYSQSRIYIKKSRDLEADGNYSSYVTELVMYGQQKNHEGLRKTLALMEAEPRHLIAGQKYTMVAMASTAYQLGDKEHAIELLEVNLSLWPRHIESHERIIQILAKLNRKDEARSYLENLQTILGETKLTNALQQLVDS